jgi:hypothetical protein
MLSCIISDFQPVPERGLRENAVNCCMARCYAELHVKDLQLVERGLVREINGGFLRC